MKTSFIFALLCLVVAPAMAQENHEGHHMPATAIPSPIEAPVLGFALFPESGPVAGEPIRVIAQLTMNGKPLTIDELEVVHTQKFHLFLADPTLTDYQHLHPKETPTPGSFLFTFTPKTTGGYRAWADITPTATKTQQFLVADIDEPKPVAIEAKESLTAAVSNYHFALAFDSPLIAGKQSTGSITVTDAKGQPVATLEPVLGAFSHIVGFYDDYKTVLHTHPLWQEPQSGVAYGGPTLNFQITPARAGFIRLFAQFKIGGQDIYAPFGMKVAAQ